MQQIMDLQKYYKNILVMQQYQHYHDHYMDQFQHHEIFQDHLHTETEMDQNITAT